MAVIHGFPDDEFHGIKRPSNGISLPIANQRMVLGKPMSLFRHWIADEPSKRVFPLMFMLHDVDQRTTIHIYIYYIETNLISVHKSGPLSKSLPPILQ